MPCLLQEEFLRVYGQEEMLEMIKAGVKCEYPVTEVNNMLIACNGNHPTHIHEEVIGFLSERDGGTYLTFTADQIKRIYMAELPLFDEEHHPLCGHKCNGPVSCGLGGYVVNCCSVCLSSCVDFVSRFVCNVNRLNIVTR